MDVWGRLWTGMVFSGSSVVQGTEKKVQQAQKWRPMPTWVVCMMREVSWVEVSRAGRRDALVRRENPLGGPWSKPQ